MASHDSPLSRLTPILQKFPDRAGLVRRLYLQSPSFRGLCDDYVLALETIAEFTKSQGVDRQPEITEYNALIPELAAEIATYLPEEGSQGFPEI